MTTIKDCQKPYFQDTVNQSTNSLQSRTHISAKKKDGYPEEPSRIASERKACRVDGPFPLKPVYHKRTLNIDRLNNKDVALKPNEFQRLPLHISSTSRADSEYTGRIGIMSHKNPAEDPCPPFEDKTNNTRASGYQHSNEERRMAKKIDMSKLQLEEKLLKTIREMHQREGADSDNNTKRTERYFRRPMEKEKQRMENKISSIEQRREMERDQEMERRERILMRDKRLENIELQRQEKEVMNRERRDKRSLAEEWESLRRMERQRVNKPESSRDERRTQKHCEGEQKEERSRRGEERAKNTYLNLEREKQDTDWARLKMSESNRWQKEEEQLQEMVEKDIGWKNKRERSSRERYLSEDDERRDMSHSGLDQGGQLKSAHRSVPGSSSSIHSRRKMKEASHISPSVHPQSRCLPPVEFSPVETANGASIQLIPCRICQRKFAAERLEKHRKVCEKMQQSSRKVFDSSRYRAQGTDLEEFMKTNSRSKTPELKKSNWRQKHETLIRNMRQGRVPAAGALQTQPTIQDNDDYVTCPHCARRFAPGPAERHIPKCLNIKCRPPPPCHHR
ncbi:hypothetical protein UPYG_G00222800 [Umbra pygmaea]|uniref:C2HC/C3H-type domain-containing protein n=1 Tax=Umbra pygmaea TaxID=75934 RepID=A0ABD0WXY1_UMBPY